MRLIFGIIIIFALFSCNENQEEEVIYSETFNINDQPDDSPEADEAFVNKYSKFVSNTLDFYSFENFVPVEESSSIKSKHTGLYQSIEFEFNLSKDSTKYFISNNLYEFKNLKDIELGWDLGESSFWSGLLKHTNRKDFEFYRDQNKYSMGDFSEYSELSQGQTALILYHLKWRNLIIQYGQIINLSMKDKYMKIIEENFNNIKKGL